MIELITPILESHWIEFSFWTAAVVISLWILRKLVRVGRFKPGIDALIRRLIPLADAAGVVFILFLLGNNLFSVLPNYRFVFVALMFLFVLWLMRLALLDVTSGIFLRFENAFGKGDRIELGEGSGIIDKVGLRCLEITMEKGKQVSVPYSQLAAKQLVRPSAMKAVKSSVFELNTAKFATISEVKSNLNREILTQPWSATGITPVIDPVEEQSEHYRFKITIYALELEHLAEIERVLRTKHETRS